MKISKQSIQKMLSLVLFLVLTLTVDAQVTIGLDEAPVQGALLQLKNQQNTVDKVNSTKGLMLPRVNLSPSASAASVTIDEKLKKSLGLSSTITLNAIDHAGLMVYNINTETFMSEIAFAENKICPGVYVWSGAQWERSMLKSCE